MKQVLLMRHAKSSWEHADLDDFVRPLANRGLKDAPMMGSFIRKIKYKPAAVFSSPAERAKQTTQLSMEIAKVNEEDIFWKKELYFGGVSDYIKIIQNAPDEHERILLVGHNPLMENTATLLAGGRSEVAIRMPTAALVCLESFAERWESITPGTCQVKWMTIPKVLKKIMDR